MAAGFHFPDLAFDSARTFSILFYRPRRPPLVWLRLPTNCLDGSFSLDRTVDRGRPQQAHQIAEVTLESGQADQSVFEAIRLDSLFILDRGVIRRLLRADWNPRRKHCSCRGQWLAPLLDALLRRRHLRERRLYARTGVPVHVPLCALSERDVRPRHVDHHLRSKAWRTAWRTGTVQRSFAAILRRLRRLHRLCTGVSNWNRHSQRLAIRVHCLRSLRRRLRFGHG